MKKFITPLSVFVLALLVGVGYFTQSAVIAEYFNNDPDIPDFVKKAKAAFSKEEYRSRRAEQLSLYRGMADGDLSEKIATRGLAIARMEEQEDELRARPSSPLNDALLAAWTPLGPDPIPNGQTEVVSTPVSGRVTAIDVHPTNPDIVYVGTAQGGVYRSLDGGVTWTPLLDGALSLAVGAVRIAPTQPETVYVGTGEPNFSADSYFGVGVYRIDNASTTANLSGPFGSGVPFQGRGIGEIIVHPTNPSMIWVASTSAAAGINGSAFPPTAGNLGLYRSDNALTASPTFAQMPNPFANQNLSVRDIEIDPLNPDLLVAIVVANGGGVVVYNNATVSPATSAVGVQRATWSSTSTSEVNGEIAIQRSVGAPQPTIYVATGNLGGRVLRSTDGGVNFPQMIDNNFCSSQCFYDIAIDTDPNDPTRVYLGGSPNLPFGISVNSGTTFASSSIGLHVDSHAITVAPSNPNIVYFGSDGGIYRSDNAGGAWTQRNTAGFRATQFMSLDTHPTDANITIGGTQDNGTNRLTTAGTWTRTDFGDGGYSVIDQSSSSIVAFNQYHTYFNASNLNVYGFTSSPTAFQNWTVRGCNGVAGNGITCTGVVNFYAPLERGPGTPNTIYYGTNRLYRSPDTGVNNATVSQIFPGPLSAIGVSPQNDNVRMVGLNNGGIFGTTTGANPLIDLDPTNAVPTSYVTRTVISQTDVNTAYVTLALFNTAQIYKTINLSSTPPTWTAISGPASGLPLVPVNAFLASANDQVLFAGTDIGVYTSIDAGVTWTIFGTGLPRVAVFDMAFAPGSILRIATHGKGLYQIPAFAPTAASVNISGRILDPFGGAVTNAIISYVDDAGETHTARSNAFGYYTFEGVEVGRTYFFSVTAKRFTFQPRAVTVNEELTELDFIAE